VVELACSYGASGHGAEADPRSQFGMGGGTALSAGSGRTATFGVTSVSGAHTGFGGCRMSGLGDGVAETGFSAGRRAVEAALAPPFSGPGVLSVLRLVRVGSEALSSLSGVVVSAVGMLQYGARHTRWKVPRPIPLEGVRRQEFGGPVRGC
jgi:hypothetical protein